MLPTENTGLFNKEIKSLQDTATKNQVLLEHSCKVKVKTRKRDVVFEQSKIGFSTAAE